MRGPLHPGAHSLLMTCSTYLIITKGRTSERERRNVILLTKNPIKSQPTLPGTK